MGFEHQFSTWLRIGMAWGAYKMLLLGPTPGDSVSGVWDAAWALGLGEPPGRGCRSRNWRVSWALAKQVGGVVTGTAPRV